MSELIEEDVIGGSTKGSKAEIEGIRPLKKVSTPTLLNLS
jgi:hypothetical protein